MSPERTLGSRTQHAAACAQFNATTFRTPCGDRRGHGQTKGPGWLWDRGGEGGQRTACTKLCFWVPAADARDADRVSRLAADTASPPAPGLWPASSRKLREAEQDLQGRGAAPRPEPAATSPSRYGRPPRSDAGNLSLPPWPPERKPALNLAMLRAALPLASVLHGHTLRSRGSCVYFRAEPAGQDTARVQSFLLSLAP